MNAFDKFDGYKKENAFDGFDGSPPVGESELTTINRVNDPNQETPTYFGLAEIPGAISDGVASSLRYQPRIVGGRAVEQEVGEARQLAQKTHGLSFWDKTKYLFMERLIENVSKDKEAPNVFELAGMALGTEKDLMYTAIGGAESSQELEAAAKGYADSVQQDMVSSGLVRPESTAGGFAFDAASGFGQMLVTAGSTIVTRDPKVGAAYMAMLQKTATHQEVINSQIAKGQKPDFAEANRVAMKTAASSAALEYIGGRYLLAAGAKSTFLKKILKRTLGQGAEEAAQATAEEAILQAEGVRDDDIERAALGVAYQAAVGIVAGVPTSTVITTAEAGFKRAGHKDPKKAAEDIASEADTIKEAFSDIYSKEFSGVAIPPEKSQTLNDIINNQVDINAYLDTIDLIVDTDPVVRINQVQEELPPSVKSNDILNFFKNYDRVKVGGWLDRELRNLGVNPRNTPGLFSRAEGMSGADNIPASEFNGITGLVAKEDGNGYVDRDWLVEQFVQERRGTPVAAGPSEVDVMQEIFGAAQDLGVQLSKAELRAAMADMAVYGMDVDTAVNGVVERDIGGEQATDLQDPRFAAEALDDLINTIEDVDAKNQAQELKRFVDGRAKRSIGFRDAMADLGARTDAALSTISTRLKHINPKLRSKLRNFEFGRNLVINNDMATLEPFLVAYSKLDTISKVALDVAMKNGDVETINQIAEKNNMMAEVLSVREMLDSLYERAKSVGMEVGYRENFFPRLVKKPQALINYFQQDESWSNIKQALEEKRQELGGRILTAHEQAYIINTLLRGYETSKVTLSRPGALKERQIDRITPEIDQFYDTTDQALIRYISTINDAVETRKFFGRKVGELETMDSSIGAYVLNLVNNGEINATDANELADILQARFNRGQMSGFWLAYKNIEYIDTMGSVISAVTQLGDTAFAMYRAGVYNAAMVLPSAIRGKSKITREDITIEKIAQEFEHMTTSGKAVQKVFDIVGLSKMDAIGKETIINSVYRKYRKQAKKPSTELLQHLDTIFGGESQSVLNDIQNDVISQNVKMLLFNDLLDLQPVALSEMPETYLRMGNGRVLYMLKTFTLKQIDIYRNEIFDVMKTNPVQGMKNMVRLIGFFVLMNASADMIKDLLLGREIEPDEMFVNNIARVFGVSKYQVYSVRREGLGTAAYKTIIPPHKIINSASKDMIKAVENGEVDPNSLESVASVPVVGKMYYWWFGAGSEKE